MANFIISYDLNGSDPSHHEVDELLGYLGTSRGRLLETVWWVDYNGTTSELRDALKTLLSDDDSLLVCLCSNAAWSNLLVDESELISRWASAA